MFNAYSVVLEIRNLLLNQYTVRLTAFQNMYEAQLDTQKSADSLNTYFNRS